jgi:DNA replication protein DnaC
MTTALLDRLLHKAKIFNLNGESYRIQNLIKGGK